MVGRRLHSRETQGLNVLEIVRGTDSFVESWRVRTWYCPILDKSCSSYVIAYGSKVTCDDFGNATCQRLMSAFWLWIYSVFDREDYAGMGMAHCFEWFFSSQGAGLEGRFPRNAPCISGVSLRFCVRDHGRADSASVRWRRITLEHLLL